MAWMTDHKPAPPAFNPAQPHLARVYDYLLGGKDNFAADRAMADRIIESLPTVRVGVRAQRAVLGRVVRYLVEEAGVRQLIDIGSGLPTVDNVHEIAQRIDPAARVIYVDNDPVVLTHARALLADDVTTIAVGGDLRFPESILGHPDVQRHFAWDRPIALLLCGILHHILDEEKPAELMDFLIRTLPSGSFVFIHHLCDSGEPAGGVLQAEMQKGLGRGQFRTPAQIGSLFNGLEMVEPGLVPVPEWRPTPGTPQVCDDPILRLACAGVARKP